MKRKQGFESFGGGLLGLQKSITNSISQIDIAIMWILPKGIISSGLRINFLSQSILIYLLHILLTKSWKMLYRFVGWLFSTFHKQVNINILHSNFVKNGMRHIHKMKYTKSGSVGRSHNANKYLKQKK